MSRELAVVTVCLTTTLVWMYEFICFPTGIIFNLFNFLPFLLISFEFPESERQAMEAALEVLIVAAVRVYELLTRTGEF